MSNLALLGASVESEGNGAENHRCEAGRAETEEGKVSAKYKHRYSTFL